MIQSLRIESIDNAHAKVYIDDKKVSCYAIDLRMRVDEIPSVKLGMWSKPDIELDAVKIEAYSATEQLHMARRRKNGW